MSAWEVTHDDEYAGEITSAIYSPRLEKNIGYAILSTELTQEGTTVTVDGPAGAVEATVVPKPFVDPAKEIPKS